MEGSKQCPGCECTDVPVNAEICPFCGYEFVERKAAQPTGRQDKKAVKLAEEKQSKATEFVLVTDKEPAKPMTEEEDKSIVSEGTAGPVSTDYTTYKKKGLRKQAVAGTAPQGQGEKAARGWLAAALAVAVLFVVCQYLIQRVSAYGRMEYLVWFYIVVGAMMGFLHVCCYANEKGSRRAGILGIVLGAGGLVFLFIRNCQEMYSSMPFTVAFSSAYSRYGRTVLILIAIYAICWLTAAMLVKNRKSAIVFCLTAAEFILLPYVADWILYWMRPQVVLWPFAVSCIAMLVTDFLLYRIKAWLAVKTRWLFWIIYFIIMVAALVYLYGSRSILR